MYPLAGKQQTAWLLAAALCGTVERAEKTLQRSLAVVEIVRKVLGNTQRGKEKETA